MGRAKQPEAGLKYWRKNIPRGENVIPRAEKSEIVASNPFEKYNGLGNLLGRKRRRCRLQRGDDVAHPSEHGLPVLYAAANLGEDGLERMHELGTLACTIHSLNVEVDEAFT